MLTLHTVQQGETINSISQKYNFPVQRILNDNDLTGYSTLNIGQVIMLAYPEQTYIVKEGDTLSSISEGTGASVIDLLKNNPSLSDYNNLNIGDELVIKYYNKDKKIQVNGYTLPHISEEFIVKILPYLTYLTIVGYQVTEDGNLRDINDIPIISLTKAYGVVPVMFVSSLDERGSGRYETSQTLLNNPDLQNKLINNILRVMQEKGYMRLCLGFQNIFQEDLPLYINFIEKITQVMNNEDYELGVVMTPDTFGYIPDEPYNQPYYFQIGQIVNWVELISFQWGYDSKPVFYQTTFQYLKYYLDFAVTQIPPEKILLGLTRIAYDWTLPYVEGQSSVDILTNSGAVEIANDSGAVIYFDEDKQTPYFYYNITGSNHFVWFKDARAVNAIVNLVYEYGIAGISVWNIMYYYYVTWLVINSQYDIVKLN